MNFTEELRYEYPLTPDSLVIDCGGYEGRFAAEIARRYCCNVEVYEPIPEFFSKCYENLHKFPKVNVYDLGICGAGAASQFARFKIKGDSTGHFADDGEDQEVTLKRADLIIMRHDKVDLLKLNIEGGEFEVLEYLTNTGLIMLIKNIQVQWHDVVENSEQRRQAIIGQLSKTHELSWDFGWTWQNWRLKP